MKNNTKIQILEMHKGKFSDKEIEDCFNKIKDPEHWKYPIEIVCEKKWVPLAEAAITHYHGVIAEVEFEETKNGRDFYAVISRGYMADSDWV
tara:strand:+ start:929 stop:1204 length:276 start_codon:yes stop_codon:yes gene_type:complete